MSHTVQLQEEKKELIAALDYCCRMLEMLCPDTAGTPAAQNGREVLAGLTTPPSSTKPPVGQQEGLQGHILVSSEEPEDIKALVVAMGGQVVDDSCICLSTQFKNPLCPIHGDVRDTSMGTVG